MIRPAVEKPRGLGRAAGGMGGDELTMNSSAAVSGRAGPTDEWVTLVVAGAALRVAPHDAGLYRLSPRRVERQALNAWTILVRPAVPSKSFWTSHS